jgi:hypothetical protein
MAGQTFNAIKVNKSFLKCVILYTHCILFTGIEVQDSQESLLNRSKTKETSDMTRKQLKISIRTSYTSLLHQQIIMILFWTCAIRTNNIQLLNWTSAFSFQDSRIKVSQGVRVRVPIMADPSDEFLYKHIVKVRWINKKSYLNILQMNFNIKKYKIMA